MPWVARGQAGNVCRGQLCPVCAVTWWGHWATQ